MGASFQWDTQKLREADRYSAWHDQLARVYGVGDVGAPLGNGFDADIAYRQEGGLHVAACHCDPHAGNRSATHVRREDREFVAVQLVISGRENFTIGESRVALGPGDLIVWNTLKPMRFEVTERLHKISVMVPLARLRGWLPERWHSVEGGIVRSSPAGGLLSSFVSSLATTFLGGSLSDGEALTEAMIGILVSAWNGEQGSCGAGRGAAQLALVKRFIDENLGDADLSPELIAHANHISLRYLHLLFEKDNTSVRRYIIGQRLQRCLRDLGNPGMAARTVTDIAFSWGFQNSTHFSRRFRAEFGLSPREYRVAA